MRKVLTEIGIGQILYILQPVGRSDKKHSNQRYFCYVGRRDFEAYISEIIIFSRCLISYCSLSDI